MGGLFGSPSSRSAVAVESTVPEIVNERQQAQDEERRRKKRKGAASQFVANSDTMENVNISKTTLGA